MDNFGITLDVSGEGLVGYWFYVNLGDSVMDGKVLPERKFRIDWDGPWVGKSFVRPDGWVEDVLALVDDECSCYRWAEKNRFCGQSYSL